MLYCGRWPVHLLDKTGKKKKKKKKTLVHTCQTKVWSLKLCWPILWSVLDFWKFSEWKDLQFQGLLTFQNKITSASEFSKLFKGVSGFCEGASKELAVQVGSLRSSSIFLRSTILGWKQLCYFWESLVKDPYLNPSVLPLKRENHTTQDWTMLSPGWAHCLTTECMGCTSCFTYKRHNNKALNL
jgi:hypothetical protein